MVAVMLTTKDNKWNPFKNFDEWYNDDVYGCCAYLDRVADTSSDFSEEMNRTIIRNSIQEILDLDPFDVYRAITEDGTLLKSQELRELR
jgi:hypothetical protein